jgi:hypothetical protein
MKIEDYILSSLERSVHIELKKTCGNSFFAKSGRPLFYTTGYSLSSVSFAVKGTQYLDPLTPS